MLKKTGTGSEFPLGPSHFQELIRKFGACPEGHEVKAISPLKESIKKQNREDR
jgi:hypothetical protein